jgi:hypothetical protein
MSSPSYSIFAGDQHQRTTPAGLITSAANRCHHALLLLRLHRPSQVHTTTPATFQPSSRYSLLRSLPANPGPSFCYRRPPTQNHLPVGFSFKLRPTSHLRVILLLLSRRPPTMNTATKSPKHLPRRIRVIPASPHHRLFSFIIRPPINLLHLHLLTGSFFLSCPTSDLLSFDSSIYKGIGVGDQTHDFTLSLALIAADLSSNPLIGRPRQELSSIGLTRVLRPVVVPTTTQPVICSRTITTPSSGVFS